MATRRRQADPGWHVGACRARNAIDPVGYSLPAITQFAEDCVTPIDLSELMVPERRWHSVTLGQVDLDVLGHLKSHCFDDAPVTDESGLPCAVVSTSDIEVSFTSGSPFTTESQELKRSFVPLSCPAERLLDTLGQHRAALVNGDGSVGVVGLVTISDLNKHAFRAQIYPKIARLEQRLADLIDEHFEDPWEWLPHLGEAKSGVVGHWEVLRKEGLDVSATSGATLLQLLTVIGSTEQLRKKLGFKSAKEFGELKGRMPRLRNAVMHPARPVVESRNLIENLKSSIMALDTLWNATDGAF